MNGTDLTKLEKTAEPLAAAFYVLAAMALVLALGGFGGYGFLLLVLAGLAHAGRAGIEEFVAARRSAPDRLRVARRAPRRRDTRVRPAAAGQARPAVRGKGRQAQAAESRRHAVAGR